MVKKKILFPKKKVRFSKINLLPTTKPRGASLGVLEMPEPRRNRKKSSILKFSGLISFTGPVYIYGGKNQIIFEMDQNFLLNHKNFGVLSKIYIYMVKYIYDG